MNRLITFLLCLFYAIVPAIAQSVTPLPSYSGGNGTESNPYLISSRADMVALADYVNNRRYSYSLNDSVYHGVHFRLTRDLTGSQDTITTVIGGSSHSTYLGLTFDGGGHEIAVNINTSGSSTESTGIFGHVMGTTVKNLSVSGRIVSDYGAVGGICGMLENGNISNCNNRAKISIDATEANYPHVHAGGITGYNSGFISNCYNSGEIWAEAARTYDVNAGGIAGESNDGIISSCYNSGKISASSSYIARAGGIVGKVSRFSLSTNVSNCYNSGEIFAEESDGSYYDSASAACSGGIAGYAFGSIISDCYNRGKVESIGTISYAYAGGITGRTGSCLNSGSEALLCAGLTKNCFSANAQITCTAVHTARTGRIVGDNNSYKLSVIENCHASSSILINGNTVSSTDASSTNGKDAPDASFKSQSWLASNLLWDFAIWSMGTGGGYPVLTPVPVPAPVPSGLYHEHDKAALRLFLSQGFNADKVGITPSDMSTWEIDETWIAKVTGVTWNNSSPKRITEISWSNYNTPKLVGNLDLSGCAALTNLNLYANQLTALNVSGCTALTQMHCDDNLLTELDIIRGITPNVLYFKHVIY